MNKRGIASIAVFMAAVILMGCSENKVVIKNIASESVRFNFRGEEYFVERGSERSVTGIPNGKYEYTTTYRIPSTELSTEEGENLSGELTFRRNETKVSVLYSSVTDSTSYKIYCNVSSSNNLEATATGY
ncbi:MAG: hypothetical protein ACOCSE_05830 [Chitinivibrionales bacterium]